jgi:hypothetical protein
MISHDLAGNTRNQGGLTAVALLVARIEPVPAFLRIGGGWLRGIRDKEDPLFGKLIHPRAGREIVGGLGAAMQHHDERELLATVLTWNEGFV